MFESLQGALDTARNMLNNDAGLLRQGLAPLARIDAALAARAARYVTDDADAGILLELPAHATEASTLLGRPGGLRGRWHMRHADKATAKDVQAGIKARDAFYRRATVTPESLARLVRLGHVLEAADRGLSLDRAGSAAPDWLQYVLNDALWGTVPDEAPHADTTLVPSRPAWDVRLLRALLAEAGLPQQMTLSIVFERAGVDAYYHHQIYRRLLAPGALDDDMLAHPDEVEFVAGVLSVAGKTMLVDRIGTTAALRDRFAGRLVRLVGEARTVRAAAARHLDALDPATSLAHLETLLRNGETEERINSADLLARLRGEAAGATLEAALAGEASRPVQQAIRAALSRLDAAADAAAIGLPEPPPMPPADNTVLAIDAVDLLLANRAQLLERLRQGAEEEAAANRDAKHHFRFRRDHYARYLQLKEGRLHDAVRALNGDADVDGQKILGDSTVVETIVFGGRVQARPDFGLMQALRLQAGANRRDDWLWPAPLFAAWWQRQDPSRLDLRQLGEAAARCGYPPDVFVQACLRTSWSRAALPQSVLPPERVWPHLAQYPELIDEGLGMAHANRPRYHNLDLGQTLSALDMFPVVPARWLPRVMEIALGDSKTYRPAAQQVLAKLPEIGKRIVEALDAGKQEVRIEAARWLARMDYRAGTSALTAALDKETRETVSAELLTALEKLGEDIGPRLAPDVLLRQARKGLKAKPPAGIAWLNPDLLPACAWQDGSPVEPEIVRWWVVLAAKLKEPAANALLVRYLGLLDAASRAALGRFLLHQFITRDTAHPSLEDAVAFARQEATRLWQRYQQLAQQHPQHYATLAALTQEQLFEDAKREKLAEYLGSAIGEKGLLALTCGAPGHELVDTIRAYYVRRAQIEAMLEAAAMSDDPAVIQFILGVARRYRTASVLQKARALVERIADRNGWTPDQLADRTVPTGGLDESGRMVFQYGAREFTAVLDEKLKPVLHNAEGKAIAALPAARQNDPPESIKEGKQLFTTCKKEVKQVVDLQTARLYEAMCAGRIWPAAEWDEYLRHHPVVGRLAQRLAWIRLAEDGTVSGVCRPTEDGSLIDANDDEVNLEPDARVGLAHAALLDADTARAWLAHFKDYKVTPLFAQLTRRPPTIVDKAADSIADRQGWTSDAFTLRGAFGKVGYQRAAAEDGGFFMEYTKDFASAGLQVRVEFSGNALPEENVPAALKTLSFVRLGAVRGFGGGGKVALGDVPPVLLAEAYGDYHAVAAACAGFDPDWERKMPW